MHSFFAISVATFNVALILLSLVSFSVLACSSASAQSQRRNLPPVRMDSFVQQAGGMAESIYGDESFKGPPPYYNFTREHRINTGIVGTRDAGLTTGHGSLMPSAWGADEYIGGPEMDYSGANHGVHTPPNPNGVGYDLSQIERENRDLLAAYSSLQYRITQLEMQLFNGALGILERARAAKELKDAMSQSSEMASRLANLNKMREVASGL
ncbi:MAG: hypothetical protein J0M35_04595 [Candidatus Obscuribacter phosphatis]|uniref:Uncharacterized protein n=1 Tax=Candidatus Obscuribacter phosphatis TaxID=1906157 RepID=A0A8J7P9A8_9BACT|nr:hypothetical protein [Candidatus Obscuribacter phosphatis]